MAGELTHDPLSGYGKRRRPIAGRLGRIGARNADVLIALSGIHANQIEKEVPTLATRKLPFGIDTERFSPYGPVKTLQGPVAILCVASMVPAKGHAVVLTAFAQAAARQEGLHLHIVGKGDCEAVLRQQSKELGISGSVTFHGHIEHHRLPEYYRGASFCVLGSYFESQGMVILEAAASGCATIGSACGSMPEFCPSELLNRPGDSMALANNLQKLATDSELRRRLATKAQEKVKSAYTIEQTACAYEELYRTCRSGS
jgi:glycosyltransferase involved in cell wall biosynthesis